MEFPEFVNGGLFLVLVKSDGSAIYQRPTITGNWNLEARYVEGVLKCTDCLAGYLIGKILTPITMDEFLRDNGNLPLKDLLK